ncbi:MAG: RNase adapter RapZ [Myxococcaceae bacterium]
MASRRDIVVITGMSGSGKSTAIRAMEDAGYFCVDNLPALLLTKLAELCAQTGRPLAVVMDVREGEFLKDAPRVLEEVRRSGHPFSVLFLDASDESLLRRFSETRRRHPLAPDGSPAEGIRLERIALRDLRAMADQVVDTSVLNVHDLKRQVQARFAQGPATAPALSVMSFGYRYGVPPQADLVFDVRFLPNPHFVPALKGLTGQDASVSDFVLGHAESQTFLEKVVELCEFLFPQFQREGKAYLTVAVGCTGGKHRSVAIAHALAQRLGNGQAVQVWDRDLDKD